MSSLGIIPGFLAIIISAFAAVFAAVFALIPLIPADDKPDTSVANPSFNAISEIQSAIKKEVQSKLWAVPYERNSFFTGREDLLTQLHEQLTTSNATALTQSQAISGLGGIGKTQIALEYAYPYKHEYTSVLWLNAQSPETLLTEFITLTDVLHLPQPEKDEYYQTRLIALIKQWFVQHERWLLILDNADNFTGVRTFLPTGGKGHIILTTREQSTGSIASIDVMKMSLEEGAAFLLRRAKLSLSSAADEQSAQQQRTHAKAIVQVLDGLPLALDQAGAYLEETPSCSLSDYLEHYHHQRQKYLARRGRPSCCALPRLVNKMHWPPTCCVAWPFSTPRTLLKTCCKQEQASLARSSRR